MNEARLPSALGFKPKSYVLPILADVAEESSLDWFDTSVLEPMFRSVLGWVISISLGGRDKGITLLFVAVLEVYSTLQLRLECANLSLTLIANKRFSTYISIDQALLIPSLERHRAIVRRFTTST